MLQVWLPLHKNLNNNGLTVTTITNSGATINAGAYQFDGTDDYIALTGLQNIFKGGTTPFSVAFWMYHIGNSRRGVIFGDYQLTGYNSGFNLEIRANNNFRFYWKGSPDWDPGFTITTQTWTHIAVVYDGSKVIAYKDGVAYTRSGQLSTMSTQGNWQLGRDARTGATAFYGKLSDFRIYDHALSTKEIAELSKGLLLHYTFYDIHVKTWNQAIRSITLATNMATLDNTLPNERKYIIKNTVTSSNRFIYTAGTTIPTDHKAAVYIKFKSNFTQRPYLRYAKASGSYTSLYPSNYVVDEWCEIKGITSGFLPGSASGILPNSNGYVANEYFSLPKEGGFMIFDLTLMFGAGNEPTVNEFFKMFPNIYYPYNTGVLRYEDTIMKDNSGMDNDAIIGGTISTIPDTGARYNYCTLFNSNSLQLDDVLTNDNKQMTISVWLKPTVNQTGCIWNGRSTTGYSFGVFYLGGGIRFDDNNGQMQCSTTLPLNQWTLVTCTWESGGQKKIYYNGELKTSGTAGANLHTNTKATIGMSSTSYSPTPYGNIFVGYMSDYRIYRKALSATETLNLYQDGVIIDNKQNIFAYEFIEEENGDTQITRNGNFKVKNIITENSDVKIFKNGNIEANQIYEY